MGRNHLRPPHLLKKRVRRVWSKRTLVRPRHSSATLAGLGFDVLPLTLSPPRLPVKLESTRSTMVSKEPLLEEEAKVAGSTKCVCHQAARGPSWLKADAAMTESHGASAE